MDTGPADLAAYVAARRPRLVRATVLMGSPPRHAAALVDGVLSRLRWAEVRDLADPDSLVWAEVLEAREADRVRWWEREEPPDLGGLDSDLDRLDVPARAARVWTALDGAAAGSAPDPLGAPDRFDADLVALAAQLPVVPPGRPAARRRTRPGLVALVVAVLVVAGGVTWWTTRPEPPQPEPPLDAVAVRPGANPAPLVWYADGRIHLPDGTAALPPLRALVAMGEGAVYLDTDGRVVRLGADGTRLLLGRADPDGGLVGNDVFSWVAFVDPDGQGVQVVDVPPGDLLARRDVPAAEDPVDLIGLRGSVLTLVDDDGAHEWDLGSGTFDALPTPEGRLVDLQALTRVYQVDPESILLHQQLGTDVVRLGVGAEVSPRAAYVLTRTGDGSEATPRVYAVGTGEELRTGIEPDDLVLDARWSSADQVTYLVARRADLPGAGEFGRVSFSGPVEVRTCTVGTGVCRTDAVASGGQSPALLAR